MANPCEFLMYAGGAGLALIAGIAFSFLVENWPWFQRLIPRCKRLAFGAICVVLGAAVVGLSYIPDLGCMPLGWWAVLVAAYNAFVAFGAGTLAHTPHAARP